MLTDKCLENRENWDAGYSRKMLESRLDKEMTG